MFYVSEAYVLGPYVTCAAGATETTTRCGLSLMSDPLRQITTRRAVAIVGAEPTRLGLAQPLHRCGNTHRHTAVLITVIQEKPTCSNAESETSRRS
jgi:hypothetical protein